VACEYVFSEAGVAIRLWVPGVIPPGLVERACLTLRSQEGVATLADLPKLLADPAFQS
jgi:hypothetical protein